MAKPSLELFTNPHQRGRNRDSKWREFFGSMKMKEIKELPDELQDKKSLHGYVPSDIRNEFVFRTNPDDNRRYVARIPADQRPKRAVNGTNKAKAGTTTAKPEPSKEPVTMTVPGKAQRQEPPKAFDAE